MSANISEKPLVSVFIPYYCDREFLPQAIESVLAQSYENFELILLNHATTDDCREIAHSYNDERIRHIDYPKNLGAGSGALVAEGLKIARGKYFKVFCADDIMHTDCLENLVDYMESNPHIDFAFGDVRYVDKDRKPLNTTWFEHRKDYISKDLNFDEKLNEIECLKLYRDCKSFLPYIGSIVKTGCLRNIHINHTYIMLFDMSLWVELLISGCKIGFYQSPIADYRVHSAQVSFSSRKNSELSARRSYFETLIWPEFFAKCKSVELIKEVFDKSDYVDNLTDVSDIPFIVHEYFFSCNNGGSYVYINNLLSNPQTLMHLENVFGYGIKEFRKTYSTNKTPAKKLKDKIYSTPTKELNILQLLWLLSRSLVNVLTLSDLRKYLKAKKKFTL